MALVVAAIILFVVPGSPFLKSPENLLKSLLDLYGSVAHQLRAGCHRVGSKSFGDPALVSEFNMISREHRRGQKLGEPLGVFIEVIRIEHKAVAEQRRSMSGLWWRTFMVWFTCFLGVSGFALVIAAPAAELKALFDGEAIFRGAFGGMCLALPLLVKSRDRASWWVTRGTLTQAARDWLATGISGHAHGNFTDDPIYRELSQMQWRDGVSTSKRRLDRLKDMAADRRQDFEQKREAAGQLMPFIEILFWSAATVSFMGPAVSAALNLDGVNLEAVDR